MFRADMHYKFFIPPPLVVFLHFLQRVPRRWPCGMKHPRAFRTTKPLKPRLFNPYNLARRVNPQTLRKWWVRCSLGHCFSLLTGLPWICAEWTSGKIESRILHSDTVESAVWPGRARQFLPFLLCGLGRSGRPGNKSPPQHFPKGAGMTQPLALIFRSIPFHSLPSLTYSL